jgi:hypothetical protein
MKLYPNPASDYFRISADAVEQLHHLWVRVYDMQGREVKHIKLQNLQTCKKIDISYLKRGTYGVSLFSDDVLLEFKILEVIR